MDNAYGYTIPLAIQDFVPVILGAVGCYLLVRTAATRVPATWRPGLIGVVLVAAGGSSKALWKLIVTTEGSDIVVLEQALFPLLAGGFGLVAWTLISGVRGSLQPWWPLAGVLAVAWIAADIVRGLAPAFIVAVGLSLVISVAAIMWATLLRAWGAVAGFVLQVVGSFSLVPLQNQEVQTLSLQWTEQGINTVAQAAFAFGAWRLWIAVTDNPTLTPTQASVAP